MSEIVWQTPPKPRHGGGVRRGAPRVWEGLLLSLREKPLEWALVRHYRSVATARHMATQLRTRSGSLAIPAGRYEYTTRTSDDGIGGDVYARYLGPEDEA